MPRTVCCVPECSIVASDGVPLHHFPNPETFAERLQVWVKNIGGNITSLDGAMVFGRYRICRRHFEKQFLYPNNRLSKLAVPTLLLPSGDISAATESPLVPESQPSTSQKGSLLNPVIQLSTSVRTVECNSRSAPTESPLIPGSQPSTSQEASLLNPEIQHSTTIKAVEIMLGDKRILPEGCKDTADLLLFLDALFDSVNGSF